MWLYLIAGGMILVGLVLGLVGGGIFTIVLIPLGLIGLAAAAFFSAGGRKAQEAGGGSANETHIPERPLPHANPSSSGRAPTSPEGLADARRAQQ
jgi:hypothetical protein